MANNLIYHYQNVIHGSKEGIYLHEAFSTRSGILYSVNPLPVEVNGDTEEEVEGNLRAMEVDSTKYKPVKYSKLVQEMSRWIDEIDISSESVIPKYEDEEELEVDYYKESGEVFDLCEYIDRNNKR